MIVKKIANSYSLLNIIGLIFTVLKTKIIWPKARIIRAGFNMRGRKYIDLGENLTTGIGCRIEAFKAENCELNISKKIIFNKSIQINDYVHISAIERVEIGSETLIASHVYISDNSHGSYKGDENDTSPEISPVNRPYFTSPVSIGKKVWIGEGVIVMPGVTIGDGAVIGAHSVVNKDVPSQTIAVGAPIKLTKKWNEDKQIWEKY